MDKDTDKLKIIDYAGCGAIYRHYTIKDSLRYVRVITFCIKKDKYSINEIEFIDELANNIDISNIRIIDEIVKTREEITSESTIFNMVPKGYY